MAGVAKSQTNSFNPRAREDATAAFRDEAKANVRFNPRAREDAT